MISLKISATRIINDCKLKKETKIAALVFDSLDSSSIKLINLCEITSYILYTRSLTSVQVFRELMRLFVEV